MMRVLIVSAAILLGLVPLAAGIMPDLPPGFPYLAGACGVGTTLPNGAAVGINCGNVGDQGGEFECVDIPGGEHCRFTFKAEADASRWINRGGLVGTITGACSDLKTASWETPRGLLPVVVILSCTVEFDKGYGGCVSFQHRFAVSFHGDLAAPSQWVDSSVGYCS